MEPAGHRPAHTTALALLLANIGSITQISTMASAGFLIIFGIVNAANFYFSRGGWQS
ncbi:MAG: hypothetical protein H6631_09630 [Anaerolineaceae bacterium]|nr:hypothetical protein [Anaerolineaceae bacterium]